MFWGPTVRLTHSWLVTDVDAGNAQVSSAAELGKQGGIRRTNVDSESCSHRHCDLAVTGLAELQVFGGGLSGMSARKWVRCHGTLEPQQTFAAPWMQGREDQASPHRDWGWRHRQLGDGRGVARLVAPAREGGT